MRPRQINAHRLFLSILTRLPHSNNRGYTLVIAIATLLVLTTLLVTYAITSKVDNTTSVSSAKSSTGFYTAEAGLNIRAQAIRAKFEGFNSPVGNSPNNWKDCTDTATGNDGTQDFACQTIASTTFNNLSTKDSAGKQIGAQSAITFVNADGNNPQSIIIPAGEDFAGLTAQEYRYDVTSVSLDNQNTPTAQLVMRFKNRLIPLFQFAAFYDDDLHFLQPPDMTINGLVHSNHNVYLDAANSNTLTISGQVSAVQSLFRGAKINNTCRGTVNIFDPVNSMTLACTGARQEFTNNAALSAWNEQIRVGVPALKVPEPEDFDATPGKEYWDKADLRIALNLNATPPAIEVWTQAGGMSSAETSNLTNSCVKQTTVLASAGNILTLNDATNFQQAGIVTIGSSPAMTQPAGATSNGYAIDPDRSGLASNQIRLINFTSPVSASTPIFRQVVSYSPETFRNYREKRSGGGPSDGTNIKMLNVDIRGILDCAGSLMGGKAINDDTEGGLVWFFTVKGPNSNAINDYGIRIYNGKDLTSPVSGQSMQGLSIISDQAVYIQGDYNCLANCNNGSGSALDDDERKPAAVMADTVNILSNSWKLDDSDSLKSISTKFPLGGGTLIPGRPATETTVNAALLSGTDITGGANGAAGQDLGVSSEGGGLNNFLRLHEDWSNGQTEAASSFFTLHYQGSMVSLSPPLRVNGKFCGTGATANCNIFNPPIRDWRFDPRFNIAANLPPITPRTVFLKQERFSRNFEQASTLRILPMLTQSFSINPWGWLRFTR